MVSMKFFTAIAATSTLAAAVPTKRQGKEFYIKTTVVSGDQGKDSLFVAGYHVGAGLTDAYVTPNQTSASKAFFNGTNLQFDYGSDYPWGLYTSYNGNEQEWQPAQINIGYGTGGFIPTDSGINSTSRQWSGWLACDWSHGVPQLFWQAYPTVVGLPTSCAAVVLEELSYL